MKRSFTTFTLPAIAVLVALAAPVHAQNAGNGGQNGGGRGGGDGAGENSIQQWRDSNPGGGEPIANWYNPSDPVLVLPPILPPEPTPTPPWLPELPLAPPPVPPSEPPTPLIPVGDDDDSSIPSGPSSGDMANAANLCGQIGGVRLVVRNQEFSCRNARGIEIASLR